MQKFTKGIRTLAFALCLVLAAGFILPFAANAEGPAEPPVPGNTEPAYADYASIQYYDVETGEKLAHDWLYGIKETDTHIDPTRLFAIYYEYELASTDPIPIDWNRLDPECLPERVVLIDVPLVKRDLPTDPTDPTVPEPSDPVETDPTVPETSDPAETDPTDPVETDPTVPETSDPVETDPTVPETSDPVETDPTVPETSDPVETDPTVPETTKPAETDPTVPETTEPKAEDSDVPDTGDETNLAVLTAVTVIALTGAAVLVVSLKKNQI